MHSSFFVILPPQLTCRPTLRSFLSNIWTCLTGGGQREQIPDTYINDIHPVAAAVYIHIKLYSGRNPEPAPFFSFQTPRQPARSLTDFLTAIAALLARRQPHNALLLHSARMVHEGIAEEKSHPGVSQLRAWTQGDWVKIFAVRFSLRTQQLQQRFPQVARSLLVRVPSDVLASGAFVHRQ